MSNNAPISHTVQSAIQRFINSEAAGGILLMLAALCALIIANSPLASTYQHFLHFEIGPVLSDKLGTMTTHLWVNDGLMAIFFCLWVLKSNASWSMGTFRHGSSARCRLCQR